VQLLALGEAVTLSVAEAELNDAAVADWTLLALDVAVPAAEAAVAEPLPLGLPVVAASVELGLALTEAVLEPVLEPTSDWVAADSAAGLLLPDSESVGDGLADGQPDVSVGLAVAVAELDAEPDGLALPEAEPDGDEPDGTAVGPALGSLPGLVVGFGGRLDLGGRTLVTSLTTGNGLSGSAEAPSR
jgi:hypothetical protein